MSKPHTIGVVSIAGPFIPLLHRRSTKNALARTQRVELCAWSDGVLIWKNSRDEESEPPTMPWAERTQQKQQR